MSSSHEAGSIDIVRYAEVVAHLRYFPGDKWPPTPRSALMDQPMVTTISLLLQRLERYVLAHVSAYPLAFLWAMASIPLAIHLNIRAIDALNDDLPAIGNFVVRRLAWPAGVVFVLPHLFGIPWAFGRDPARWRKPTWIAIAAVAAVGLLFGGVSWLWLFLR